MKVKMIKDSKWKVGRSFKRYKDGDIADVKDELALEMIKHEYAEEIEVEAEVSEVESEIIPSIGSLGDDYRIKDQFESKEEEKEESITVEKEDAEAIDEVEETLEDAEVVDEVVVNDSQEEQAELPKGEEAIDAEVVDDSEEDKESEEQTEQEENKKQKKSSKKKTSKKKRGK